MTMKRTYSFSIVGCIVFITLTVSACVFVARSYRLETPAEMISEVTTEDGWVLPLYYYPAQGGGPPRASAILCHGLAVNRFNLDFDEERSLARFLARNGYEVWVMERRGAGNSHRVGGGIKPYDWNFDDYVFQDVPTVLRYVREHARSSDLVWIGHSAGSMVIYAYLSRYRVPPPFRVVAIASPAEFDFLHDYFALHPLRRDLAKWFVESSFDVLPLKGMVDRLFPIIVGLSPDVWISHVLFNPENMSQEIVWEAFANAPANVPRTEFVQWFDWAESGDFRTADRQFSYRDHLHHIDVPILFIAGSADHLGVTEAVLYAYEHVSSSHKTFREFSRANGDSADYGHIDLVLGVNAPREVFPFITEWLAQTDY